MKRLSKHKFVTVFLPKHNCYTGGGRNAAIWHFEGFNLDICKVDNCEECQEIKDMIEELIEVDVGFRREWRKLSARYARVPQRQSQRAEYHRKSSRRKGSQ